MTKTKNKVLSAILAMVMLLSMLPLSVMAAPASDLPDNMVDSPILRALEYTGYDVQKQKDNGTLYQSGNYASGTPASVLSDIGYGISLSGKETVSDSSTPTGKAPNIARFEDYGLCCASFVTYYLCNYLPNIEGADMDYIVDAINATGTNSQSVTTWQRALNNLIDDGIVEKIGTSSSNVDRDKLTPGDLIIFGNDESATTHIAVYSGTYKGTDFLIHVGNSRGPEIMPVKWMSDSSNGNKASYPNGYYHLPEVSAEGMIEVYKKDTDGNPLAGAYFTAISTVDSTLQYRIGPTNSKGYAYVEGVEYSTYLVKESAFPAGFQSYGKTEWTVTLDKNTPNATITINAVNEQIPGNCEITKHSEDGNVDGITFRIVGNGVDKTAVTSGAKVLFSGLKPGTYEIFEVTPGNYVPQASQKVTVVSGQTAKITFSNSLKKGSVYVTKDAEDGLEEGTVMHLYGTSDAGVKIDEYATVGGDKIARFENIPIASRLTLEECNVPIRYEVPAKQTVTVYWNEVTKATVVNKLKRGDLHLKKDAEDGLPEGSKFHLYGPSDSGIMVDEYATADSNGDVWFKGILMTTAEGLTVEEVEVNSRYVIPDKQTVNIYWNEVTEITVNNILKKWRADVYKVDREFADQGGDAYGQTQGDASLAGAVYGLYKGSQLIDTYTTDSKGHFITKYYVCDTDYTLRELSSSPGYLVDSTVYPINCSAENYTVELNTEYFDVYEQVLKGRIALIKHTDNGETQIETPETGAEFEVYLLSAGSYESAKETERDILVCDENGFDESKDLPAGTYRVTQTKSWEGRELLDPFDVVINQDGAVYRFIINNANFESYIKVTKTDATTGKVIPCAGTGFQIYDPEGNLVTMTFTYPTPTVIDTFYTDANGVLVTPETLPYGKGYKLVEVASTYGYTLSDQPVYFDVTAENGNDENGIPVINVTFANQPQMGTVTITKTGEIFASVTETDGMYQPVYKNGGLEGTVYDIIAVEDIYTPDGTQRYSEGEVVDTVIIGPDSTATTKPLHLGKFMVKEVAAVHGMVLNSEPSYVELTYAGEHISITTTATEFYNERQKVVIDLAKTLESNELFGVGLGDEILSVKFAMYAAEDINAADGSVIPKDGLIEIGTCGADGKLTFATDLPVDAKVYIREYATDEHYILSDTIYPVSFEYAGQDTAIVHIGINDGATITNDLIYGTVIGKKVDEDGFSIAGARFGLFHPDTTEFTEENAIMVSESNEIGVFGFEAVPFGKWLVKELQPAPAFVLNETVYEVTVSEHEQIVEITVENRFIVGSVQTTKVDAEYPENKLSGVIFEYYVDVDGNKEFDAEIDLLAGELTEISTGVYRADNLRYNGYFLHEKIGIEGFLKDDGYYYFDIRADGETVNVENKAGIGFINQPIKGNILIQKKDADTDAPLSGVEFGIFDLDGNELMRGTTMEDGTLLFEGIRYGQVEIRELTQKTGYYKNDEPILADITEHGVTLTYEIENQKIPPEPEVPESPKTGDNSNIGMWFAFMLLSLGAIIGLSLYARKSRNN